MSVSDTNRWHAIIQSVSQRPTLAFFGFLAGLALVALLGLNRADGRLFNSDLIALVAPHSSDPAQQAAIERIQKISERRQTWMVSHKNQGTARRTAIELSNALLKTDLFSDAGAGIDIAGISSFYQRFPYRFADDASLTVAQRASPTQLVEQVERSLYVSGGAFPGVNLASDPFLLLSGFLRANARTPPPFTIQEGMLAARMDGQWTFVLPVMLKGSAFDFDYQIRLQKATTEIADSLQSSTGASITSVGTINFATANRELAIHEVTLISGASLVLILALLFATFRHPRPFLAVGFTLISGTAGGISACLIGFQSVHLLTLIAGSSLIGITVDYAFHLLVDGYRHSDEKWQTASGLMTVLPTISLGLLTSLLGFTGLYASGFLGLQQIAIFSGAGLITAYLCLLLGYPLLLRGWQPRIPHPFSLRAADAWQHFYQPGRIAIVVLAFVAPASLLLLPEFKSNSDIRLLTARAPDIDRLLERSASLSALLLDSRFLLVNAENTEALLRTEESLRLRLSEQIEDGTISHFTQISSFVPSKARQEEILELNKKLLLLPGSAVELLQNRIGLSEDAIADARATLSTIDASEFLSLELFSQSPLASVSGDLYLGNIGGTEASIVTLAGINNLAKLKTSIADLPGIKLIDNVSDISTAFALYVENAIRGFTIAFVLVAILMILKFGLKEGCTTMLVPLVTFCSTLFLLQILGESINLFHIVALTLVLGIGMDYVLFLKSGDRGPHSMLAVLLAAITTECAFGLLGFSQVGAIHSFGITVALGTAIAFLLAPMVSSPTKKVPATLREEG